MRILVVEDEAGLVEALRKSLREEGYAVDVARDGEEGIYKATVWDYDAVVLDIMLPKHDGWQVLRRIRGSNKVPVLMLTARDTLDDRIRGLDGGADDYLVKPFEIGELLARLRALIRRASGQPRPLIEIGDIVIDTTARRVTKRGREDATSASSWRSAVLGACFTSSLRGHEGSRGGRRVDGGRAGTGRAPGSLLAGFDSNADGALSGDELAAGLAARQADLLEDVDTNGDGSIGADELEAIDDRRAERIRALDADGDGAVSAAELAANLEERKAEILEKLDTDGDGTIEAEELAAYEPEGSDRRFSGGRRLEELDADSDGTVSGEELAAGLSARQADWLDEVDTDGDGAINAVELDALGDRFASKVEDLDADGDGAVSAAELAADLEARKAAILERLDANGNGDLEPDELAAAPRGCMDTDEEEAAAGQVEAEALVLGSGEPEFLRGDASADGRVDISDALNLAGSLYLGSAAPSCMDAADSNDDGTVDLSDVITILVTLFRGTSGGIAIPYPEAGVDATEDSLPCER